ncbi:MAG: Sec-independent protein translocase protein TatB [bacterium]
MFGMGWQEIMLILVIGVLVIGPDQLPGVARTIGKLVAQFKRATNDLRTAVSEEIGQQEEFAEFKEFASDLESEVNDIQDTAKELVDKEIEKGEQELGQLEAEVSDSGDSDGKHPERSADSMPTGEYGPTLDAADGGDSADGDGAVGDSAVKDGAVGDRADEGGTSAADTTQKESA